MNFETWNMKLWIDNDQGMHIYWRQRAQEIKDHPTYINESMSLDRRIVTELSKELDAHFDNLALDFMGNQASCFADILNNALNEVHWKDIAESLLNDL